MPISITGDRVGMRAAARVIEKAVIRIVRAMPVRTTPGPGSRKIPPTVESHLTADFGPGRTLAYVTAGGPNGLLAPEAFMFETPGARHPLFGDKNHWYAQPYRPFLEEAAESAGQDACEKYANEAFRVWARESGYK